MQSFDIKELMSRLQGLDQRKADDEIYAQIFDEYTSGIMDKVAQTRAMESAGGDQEKIKSEYIRFRFIRIKDEIAAFERAARNKQTELNANRKAEERRKRAAAEALREEVKNRQAEKDAQQYSAFKTKSNRANFKYDKTFGSDYDLQLEEYHRKKNSESDGAIWLIVGIFAAFICAVWMIASYLQSG